MITKLAYFTPEELFFNKLSGLSQTLSKSRLKNSNFFLIFICLVFLRRQFLRSPRYLDIGSLQKKIIDDQNKNQMKV